MIEIDVVPEGDRNLGKAKLRNRSNLLLAGQAAHNDFERESYVFFNFRRSEGRGEDVHLHLIGGDVGHGIDRQSKSGVDAEGRDHKGH